jgi:hypothetical protein
VESLRLDTRSDRLVLIIRYAKAANLPADTPGRFSVPLASLDPSGVRTIRWQDSAAAAVPTKYGEPLVTATSRDGERLVGRILLYFKDEPTAERAAALLKELLLAASQPGT